MGPKSRRGRRAGFRAGADGTGREDVGGYGYEAGVEGAVGGV